MAQLGVAATEFGPDDFLPADPTERAETLARHGMHAVGGFVPVVLHDDRYDPTAAIAVALTAFQRAGARRLVLAADTGSAGYEGRPELSDAQWARLLGNLEVIAVQAQERGIVASIHPHVGTMIESADDVARVLAGSTVGLCLDTGHLLIGGSDPVALAVEHPDRVTHVHLKDVRLTIAAEFRRGELTYLDAVRQGMYAPLGGGDVDVARIVAALENAGYNGYYVLEQDTILEREPPANTGPIDDVRRSLDFITRVAQP
ncbi:MAG: inosose dehydratase [Microbacteriaceae bacterium]|nr:MAG: inosose dehydratase [Microbacteriaceae bacterium]